MSEKIKVIIVDDLASTRESVVKLLQFEPNVTLVAEAGTGLEAGLTLSHSGKPTANKEAPNR